MAVEGGRWRWRGEVAVCVCVGEGGGQVAVEEGRREMAVEEWGGSGGTEVSVEEVEVAVEGGGGMQQDTSLRATVPDLQS